MRFCLNFMPKVYEKTNLLCKINKNNKLSKLNLTKLCILSKKDFDKS